MAAVILYVVSKNLLLRKIPKSPKSKSFCLRQTAADAAKRAAMTSPTPVPAWTKPVFSALLPRRRPGRNGQDSRETRFSSRGQRTDRCRLRCNGTCKNAPAKICYDGVSSCRIASRISSGQTGCPTGCLRLGDCVKVCKFDALHIDPETGIPVVDEDKCTSCGACVKMCPRQLFEIRPKGKNGNRVYVACRNTQKGAVARKTAQSHASAV